MTRSLIVRHADGFVHHGQLNVTLAHQIYWLGWVFYNAYVLIVFPITPLLASGNMNKSKVVKLCMFTRLGEEEEDNDKNQTTSFLVNMFGGLVSLFYTTFFTRRVNNYKANFFPNGRMSAVGAYKRNVITFSTTTKLAFHFIFCFSYIMKIARFVLFKYVDLTYMFYIECFFWFLIIDLFYVCFSLVISSQELPSKTNKSISNFPKPINLEPRREFIGKTKGERKLIFVKPSDHCYDNTAGSSRFCYI